MTQYAQVSTGQPVDPITGSTVALVPLADLYIHDLNTRSEPPAEDIALLAESIDALGLLQNLSGFADPTLPADVAWHIGIVAGGRRLRAVRLLAERQGRDPSAVTVPVRITGNIGTARLWASAENAARQALPPGDEIRAYGRMRDAGADPFAIARAFGVGVRHVKQRLTLSSRSEELIAAIGNGTVTLDQAGALASADTVEAERAMLSLLGNMNWQPTADWIRNQLHEARITTADRRVKCIGLEAYLAAGGRVQEDFFADDCIRDLPILEQLAMDRLERLAEEEREAGGWKWVKAHPEGTFGWQLTEKMTRMHRVPVDLPEADEAELAELQERSGEEMTDAELDRMNELETRQAGDYSDDDRASSGRFAIIANDGQVRFSEPYQRPEDKPREEGEDPGTTDAKPIAAEKLSQAVLDDHVILRRLSIATALLDQPELMLDILAVSILAPVSSWHRPLALGPTPQALEPSKPEGAMISERLADVGKMLSVRSGTGDLLPGHLSEVRAMGKKARNAVITAALAAIWCRDTGEFAAHVAELTGANVRKVWTPSAENYFGRLPSGMLDAIWLDLVPEDRAEASRFTAQKKGDKAKDLGKLFSDADFREALQLDRATNARIDSWLPKALDWAAIGEGQANG